MAGSRIGDLLSELEAFQNRLEERARAMPDSGVTVRLYSDGSKRSLHDRLNEVAVHIMEHLEEE